jgi:N-acetylneuraminate synthase/N,N'-diacetyllegionaminate synthase
MVPAESEGALLGRRSLHWAKSLASGSVVAEQDMLALRPGDGVSPERWTEFVGRRLSRDVQAGERLAPGDVL